MKIYDKAAWHIDGGENIDDVITRLRKVFLFLDESGMLNEEGKETLEYGMDSSVSLNSNMVTKEGNIFLDACYDHVINTKKIEENLLVEYEMFMGTR